MNLDLPSSQTRFAAIVGITQPRASQLVAAGVLTEGAPLGDWLKAYCSWLRDQAAGRTSENGPLDLVQERARLSKEQADLAEMKRRQMQRELILLQTALDAVGVIYTQARDRLLSAGARLAPLVAYESDVAKCSSIPRGAAHLPHGNCERQQGHCTSRRDAELSGPCHNARPLSNWLAVPRRATSARKCWSGCKTASRHTAGLKARCRWVRVSGCPPRPASTA